MGCFSRSGTKNSLDCPLSLPHHQRTISKSGVRRHGRYVRSRYSFGANGSELRLVAIDLWFRVASSSSCIRYNYCRDPGFVRLVFQIHSCLLSRICSSESVYGVLVQQLAGGSDLPLVINDQATELSKKGERNFPAIFNRRSLEIPRIMVDVW